MSMVPEDRIADWELRVEEQARRTQRLSESIERSTSSAESPGGEVVVTVDSTGGLAGLRFRREAGDLPLDRLDELVLATSKRAQARMAEQVSDLVEQLYGSGSGTAQFIRTAYSERFAGEAERP
ncbi:YbaB/EbfC family nucleoid-associated protein [Actinoplanes sp. NPDC049596]|uniref:YbaB/EbfC family nucleoid-associated protein n=1 Tax=unclassified Actinoplanes TaxID=2626549 RepID=UPI00344AD54D